MKPWGQETPAHHVLSFIGINPRGHVNRAAGILPMERQAQRGYSWLEVTRSVPVTVWIKPMCTALDTR